MVAAPAGYRTGGHDRCSPSRCQLSGVSMAEAHDDETVFGRDHEHLVRPSAPAAPVDPGWLFRSDRRLHRLAADPQDAALPSVEAVRRQPLRREVRRPARPIGWVSGIRFGFVKCAA